MNGYQHEALDRCHVILCTIEDHLHSHPFVQQNADVELLVARAVRTLADAYQLIGSKETGNEQR